METSDIRRRLMDAVNRATPWTTTAEVPPDDIANAILVEFGLDNWQRAVERVQAALDEQFSYLLDETGHQVTSKVAAIALEAALVKPGRT